ncbi:MAG TPA: 50S ribosomal protein L15 [Candidatus Saccharimonadales bacterium]|nr:50S ribosomal protein L15 [Candidatus Saccharimonadales bacterium]
MKYHELKVEKQLKKNRVGRGISAGRGKTAGRGTKGQGARKSGGVRPGFEGGQMPLYMRLPHLRGFKSHKARSEVVYVDQLNNLPKSVIDNRALFEAGLVKSPHSKIKLLQRGELKTKKDVKLQLASTNAQEAIKKAGGSFSRVGRLPRPKSKVE